MHQTHLCYLVCPSCQGELQLSVICLSDELIKEGTLFCHQCKSCYPIINFIPRFVPFENYASSFGFEWQMHKKTQYDSQNKVQASKRRFYNQTKWQKSEESNLKKDQTKMNDLEKSCVILEAGCGAGRFSAYALEVCGGGGD